LCAQISEIKPRRHPNDGFHPLDVLFIPTHWVSTLPGEIFGLAMRVGHPYADDPSLARYCHAQHLVVSLEGDPHGFVDEVLARKGRARRVALTVPNFMFALALLAESDLICAVPRRFAAAHAARFGVVAIEAPLPLGQFRMNIVAPKVAMMDAGLAWLVGLLQAAGPQSIRKALR
jgi:DNA-binding transcriptional LysR family regulator